jgi:hypothetical protein
MLQLHTTFPKYHSFDSLLADCTNGTQGHDYSPLSILFQTTALL